MEKNIEIIGDEFINNKNNKKTIKIKKETKQQILPLYELILNSNEPSITSLRLANIYKEEKCIIRCSIGDESRQSFIPSTLILHKNGKRIETNLKEEEEEEENDGSISYEFIPWKEENNKKINNNNNNKKLPILFHCSAEIFPDEAKRKGRRHFPQLFSNKNIIYQRTLKITPKIGIFPCENTIKKENNYCKNGGLCYEMNNNNKYCLCPEKYIGHYCEQYLVNGILINSTFLPISTLILSSFILFFLFIIIILNLFLIKEKRKSAKMRKNILKFNNNYYNNNSKIDQKENESTPLEYFYNKKDDPCDNNKSLKIKNNNNLLLPKSPIPQITNSSPSRIPRLYSSTITQIKRIKEEDIDNFEEEKLSKNNSNESSESGGEYDNLEKLCAEIQKQKNILETKRIEYKQNNNNNESSSSYMNLILLEKGENV